MAQEMELLFNEDGTLYIQGSDGSVAIGEVEQI